MKNVCALFLLFRTPGLSRFQSLLFPLLSFLLQFFRSGFHRQTRRLLPHDVCTGILDRRLLCRSCRLNLVMALRRGGARLRLFSIIQGLCLGAEANGNFVHPVRIMSGAPAVSPGIYLPMSKGCNENQRHHQQQLFHDSLHGSQSGKPLYYKERPPRFNQKKGDRIVSVPLSSCYLVAAGIAATSNARPALWSCCHRNARGSDGDRERRFPCSDVGSAYPHGNRQSPGVESVVRVRNVIVIRIPYHRLGQILRRRHRRYMCRSPGTAGSIRRQR